MNVDKEYIYIIKDSQKSKVGITKNPESLRSRYRTPLPNHKIKFVIRCNNAEYVEKEFHKIYGEQSIKNNNRKSEWYNFSTYFILTQLFNIIDNENAKSYNNYIYLDLRNGNEEIIKSVENKNNIIYWNADNSNSLNDLTPDYIYYFNEICGNESLYLYGTKIKVNFRLFSKVNCPGYYYILSRNPFFDTIQLTIDGEEYEQQNCDFLVALKDKMNKRIKKDKIYIHKNGYSEDLEYSFDLKDIFGIANKKIKFSKNINCSLELSRNDFEGMHPQFGSFQLYYNLIKNRMLQKDDKDLPNAKIDIISVDVYTEYQNNVNISKEFTFKDWYLASSHDNNDMLTGIHLFFPYDNTTNSIKCISQDIETLYDQNINSLKTNTCNLESIIFGNGNNEITEINTKDGIFRINDKKYLSSFDAQFSPKSIMFTDDCSSMIRVFALFYFNNYYKN